MLREQDSWGVLAPRHAQLLISESLWELLLKRIHRTPCTYSIWGALQHPHHSLFTVCVPATGSREGCGPLALSSEP